MYITFEEYGQLYNDLNAGDFNRLCLMACKLVDNMTTGLDGVRKLKEHFPIDDDAEYVKLCVATVTHDLHMFESFESGLNKTEGRQIASVSSGSESISFVNTENPYAYTGAQKTQWINKRIEELLRGTYDSNGVSLLFRGAFYV